MEDAWARVPHDRPGLDDPLMILNYSMQKGFRRPRDHVIETRRRVGTITYMNFDQQLAAAVSGSSNFRVIDAMLSILYHRCTLSPFLSPHPAGSLVNIAQIKDRLRSRD